ncbi:hypothetical protein [Streptomyces spectabilis]|uniref:Uncharacterized protein n=1 Tax=Streptomyces spectabilis TaxID=68270 RepID=A0A5P2WZS6_STRST|nr:hypothetical protein [Streptomyces spectabilis]MBB5107270.1 hypothetical protein [Streptomyces spectabilis]MCI3899971.1 hypothetical protein [Streptomyces spectabilis]QEV57608.1 hypothetical protein CP982_01830 [Streptomyces spectabilis]GGV36523.1 hypothetical protein GCM10010245_58170 [Streptomyces spectabilis]
MLRITADIFSGRPDPVSDITDESEVRALLREVDSNRSLFLSEAPPEGGLGVRGFWLEPLNDELGSDFGTEPRLYLPVGAQARGGRAAEIGERLVTLMESGEPAASGEAAEVMDASLRDFVIPQLAVPARVTVTDQTTSTGAGPEAEDGSAEGSAEVSTKAACTIELGAFNPGFWNNDSTVRLNNNCYNYASNWRTNTFAQPGRGCGNMYKAITCAEVTRASLCDGMHHRFDCFPDTEKPRYLVALVIAPGPGFIDFHWFRKQNEGFWGHKPGSTAARNTDNSGNVIFNPETANRGPYTVFCGYFYGCNSQRQRIR